MMKYPLLTLESHIAHQPTHQPPVNIVEIIIATLNVPITITVIITTIIIPVQQAPLTHQPLENPHHQRIINIINIHQSIKPKREVSSQRVQMQLEVQKRLMTMLNNQSRRKGGAGVTVMK